MAWNRNLWGVVFSGRWGVVFSGRVKDEKPMLLGQAWHKVEMIKPTYDGEPTRALLFTTRKACRDWCKEQNIKMQHLGWRFLPVKVREIVEIAED